MKDCNSQANGKGIGFFERYLTVWVILCIVAGIALGKLAPNMAASLDAMAIYVGDAPVVSIPIALCLFFMMYPIMVKIDFGEVLRAGKSIKPVGLTLLINWAIKPFTMYAISVALPLVAGYLSRKWIIALKGIDWFKEKFLFFPAAGIA